MSSQNKRRRAAVDQAVQMIEDAIDSATDAGECERIRRRLKFLLEEADAKLADIGLGSGGPAPPVAAAAMSAPVDDSASSRVWPAIPAEKLGLDPSRSNNHSAASLAEINEAELVDYMSKPCPWDEERLEDACPWDEERLEDPEKLVLTCAGCGEESELPGVFHVAEDPETGASSYRPGLRCPRTACRRPDNWGEADPWACVAKILNKVSRMKRDHQRRYYDGLTRCDDPLCKLETRQISVDEGCCPKPGCDGRMRLMYTEKMLQTQLEYFDSLFDISRACKQLERSPDQASSLPEKEVMKSLAMEDKEAFHLLHGFSSQLLKKSGYNWIGGLRC